MYIYAYVYISSRCRVCLGMLLFCLGLPLALVALKNPQAPSGSWVHGVAHFREWSGAGAVRCSEEHGGVLREGSAPEA